MEGDERAENIQTHTQNRVTITSNYKISMYEFVHYTACIILNKSKRLENGEQHHLYYYHESFQESESECKPKV